MSIVAQQAFQFDVFGSLAHRKQSLAEDLPVLVSELKQVGLFLRVGCILFIFDHLPHDRLLARCVLHREHTQCAKLLIMQHDSTEQYDVPKGICVFLSVEKRVWLQFYELGLLEQHLYSADLEFVQHRVEPHQFDGIHVG